MRLVFARLRLVRLSIRARLGLIQGLLLLALAVISVVAWRAISDERHSGETLALLSRAERHHLNTDVMLDALRTDVNAAMRVQRQDSQVAGEILVTLHENVRKFETELEALRGLELPGDLKRSFNANYSHEVAYITAAKRLVTTAMTDHEAAAALEPAFNVTFDELNSYSDEMTLAMSDRVEAAERDALQDAASAKFWIVVTGVVTTLAAWAFVAVIAHSVRQSLRQVCEAARALATGNLSVRSEVASEDEVGELAGSLNKMADDLQSMVDRLLADADRDAFGAKLTQALEMAESEPDVYGIAARGMAEIGADMPMEFLLADPNLPRLLRVAEHPTAGAPKCGVESPSSCTAIRRGAPIVFPDSEALNACPWLRKRPQGPLAATCVPVSVMGRSAGVLHAIGPLQKPTSAQQLVQMTTLGVQAGARIGGLRTFEHTRMHAYSDGLTGLSNRRALEQAVHDLAPGGSPYALVLADLDQFKRLNDTRGHEVGDKALRVFADVLKRSIREADRAARWGGEEFAIFFPELSAAQVFEVVERIRSSLAETLLASGGAPFTASFGIADSTMGSSFEECVRHADEALYRSKDAGRDRATIASVYLARERTGTQEWVAAERGEEGGSGSGRREVG